MGVIASAAGFFGYYTVMYYYGFTFNGLFGMAILPTYSKPDINDAYDINSPTLGNSNLLWGKPCDGSATDPSKAGLVTNSAD